MKTVIVFSIRKRKDTQHDDIIAVNQTRVIRISCLDLKGGSRYIVYLIYIGTFLVNVCTPTEIAPVGVRWKLY